MTHLTPGRPGVTTRRRSARRNRLGRRASATPSGAGETAAEVRAMNSRAAH